MKCCMVACINILYPENRLSEARRSAAADGSAISCFLRVSDHLESICKILFSPVTTADSPVAGAGGRPFLPLENVNTSYHSEFQQILSINVVGEHVFKKRCQNFTFQKLPKIWLNFLTILTEFFFLQIDSKWSEMRKKHKIGDAKFLRVAGAGNRRSTIFPSREC